MEVVLVVADEYAEEFSKGGGFLIPPKQAGAPDCQPPPEQPLGLTGSAYVNQFPSECTTTHHSNDSSVGHKVKRTCLVARYSAKLGSPCDSRLDTVGNPHRLSLILGRDPASCNAVVKHTVGQGALLSRRHFGLRVWFARSVLHPTMLRKEKEEVAGAVPIAFDVSDFGSLNGTFVDGVKLPSTGMPCHPIVVDARQVFAASAKQDVSQGRGMVGLRVATLSFGTGSRVAEGGRLLAEHVRLIIHVHLRIPADSACQTPADLVTQLFLDTIPKKEIDAPFSSRRSSRWLEEIEEAQQEDVGKQIEQQQFTGVTGGQLTMLDSPTRQSRMLLAARSSAAFSQASHTTRIPLGIIAELESRSLTELPTSDVVSGILRDHGFQNQLASTTLSSAVLQPAGQVPTDAEKTQQKPAAPIVLESGSVTKDSLPPRELFDEPSVVEAAAATRRGEDHVPGSLPAADQAAGVSDAVDIQQLEPLLLFRGSRGGQSTTGKDVVSAASNGIAPIVLTTSAPREQHDDALLEGMPLSQGAELSQQGADASCAEDAQLLARKKAAALPEKKKSGGRQKRVVDPLETITRFCDELRRTHSTTADTAPADSVALARSVKASLLYARQFVSGAAVDPALTKHIAVAEPMRTSRPHASQESDDDIPLKELLRHQPRGQQSYDPIHGSAGVLAPESLFSPPSSSSNTHTNALGSFRPVDAGSSFVAATAGGSEAAATAREEAHALVVVVPPENLRGAECQLEEFISSQFLSGGGDAHDEVESGSSSHAPQAGGCKIVAGRVHPSDLNGVVAFVEQRITTEDASQLLAVPPQSLLLSSAPRLQQHQPAETLRCLFDDDESSDVDHRSISVRHPSAAVNHCEDMASLKRFATSTPPEGSAAAQAKTRSSMKVCEMDEPEVAGVKKDTKPSAVLGDTRRSDRSQLDNGFADVTVLSDSHHVVRSSSSRGRDESCASWAFSQAEVVLVASQDPNQHYDHGSAPSQSAFLSQLSLTRCPTRCVFFRSAPVSTALPLPNHEAHASAKAPQKRVTFNQNIATVAGVGNTEGKKFRDRAGAKKLSAAAARRAKLEAVLEQLPPADEETQPKSDSASIDERRNVLGQLHWQLSSSQVDEADKSIAPLLQRIVFQPNEAEPGVHVYATQHLRSVLKPHQWEALQFIWRCLMREAPTSDKNCSTKNSVTKGGTKTCFRSSPAAAALSTRVTAPSAAKKRRVETTGSAAPPPSGKMFEAFDNEDDANDFSKRSSTHYDFGVAPRSDEDSSSNGPHRGCMLAHAMGLGKTLTTVSFLFTLWRYLSQHSASSIPGMHWLETMQRGGGARTLVIVPKALVCHWIRELHRWSVELDEDIVTIYLISQDTKSDKLSLIREWAAEGTLEVPSRSVLLTTHSTLTSIMMSDADANESLTKPKSKQSSRRRSEAAKKRSAGGEAFWCDEFDGSDSDNDDIDDHEPASRRATRLLHYQQCREVLLKSTNLVVVDEVHRLQRIDSRLSRSVCQFRGPGVMKLGLTGTPITSSQRSELLAVTQFLMPSLWTLKDLSDRALTQHMTKFVHGCTMATLAEELPPIVEHTITVRMSPTQRKLFQGLIQQQQERGVIPSKRLLDTTSKTMLISNHCDLVADWLRRRADGVVEVSSTLPETAVPQQLRWALPSLTVPSIFDESETDGVPAPVRSLDHSWKMRVLVGLLHGALGAGERVAVFSHSVKTLFLLGKLLTVFGLVDGEHFALLDGRVPSALRDEYTAQFNDHSSQLQILLLSFVSCSVGQNFTGANRVILVEASWRPALDVQAICRVYRYGQTRPVYVNRLLSDNGIEARLGQLGMLGSRKDGASNCDDASRALGIIGADELLHDVLMKKTNASRHVATAAHDEVLEAVLRDASCVASVAQVNSF